MYGMDELFEEGLNLVASYDNTRGKSSVLAAIYYCLGLEQILGGAAGIGGKVLTSALKSTIEDDGKPWNITESGAYLEITNGTEIITIYRTIKSDNRDSKLVTVYYGAYASIGNPKTQNKDFYVNTPNAAIREQGFHSFLENFLHLNLPLVHTTDGAMRKLYIQVVFSAMFIEQKHGWSAILSGMPLFGIRESKRRVVEYILGLDTLKNEKEREELSTLRAEIESEWADLIKEIQMHTTFRSCNVLNLPISPKVLSDKDFSRIDISTEMDVGIEERVSQLKLEYESLRELKPRVRDNFEALNVELSETEGAILEFEEVLQDLIQQQHAVESTVGRLISDIQIINEDIRNNEDAARLQKFGSEAADKQISAHICPTCKQEIQDNLLDANPCSGFMNIEENLRHLKAQKSMLEFSLAGRKATCETLQGKRVECEHKLLTLRRLAQSLRSDLYTSTDTDASEAILLKKIELSRKIEELSELRDFKENFVERLKELSVRWNTYLDRKSRLPTKGISESDASKIALLKSYFTNNLKRYHYSSLSNLGGIEISRETLLPTIDGFDMKFDSSASDGIRTIWAFTLALLQVSLEKDGNHPGVIILDEPAQQSIVSEDMDEFISSLVEISSRCQVIMAITLNSKELIQIVGRLDERTYHKTEIVDKAFKKYD